MYTYVRAQVYLIFRFYFCNVSHIIHVLMQSQKIWITKYLVYESRASGAENVWREECDKGYFNNFDTTYSAKEVIVVFLHSQKHTYMYRYCNTPRRLSPSLLGNIWRDRFDAWLTRDRNMHTYKYVDIIEKLKLWSSGSGFILEFWSKIEDDIVTRKIEVTSGFVRVWRLRSARRAAPPHQFRIENLLVQLETHTIPSQQ